RVVADCTRRVVPAGSVKTKDSCRKGKIPVEMLEPLKMAQMAETSFFKPEGGQGRHRPMT
ncbi:MAG TPA: hypothetical protein VFB28_00130, partial [Terriglobales bacterium]|nr:hypothetical protein [Terriglobales bacterium]